MYNHLTGFQEALLSFRMDLSMGCLVNQVIGRQCLINVSSGLQILVTHILWTSFFFHDLTECISKIKVIMFLRTFEFWGNRNGILIVLHLLIVRNLLTYLSLLPDLGLSVIDLLYDDGPNVTVEERPTFEDHVAFSLEGLPCFSFQIASLVGSFINNLYAHFSFEFGGKQTCSSKLVSIFMNFLIILDGKGKLKLVKEGSSNVVISHRAKKRKKTKSSNTQKTLV